uniref:Uncharacterized protein n=1 Tax=Lactuca sativa TaxID=4236 RepID=A0A9R1XE22_LACSA|nr:hypothetical protein LSAT_V11C500244390 [Lactuca sativa]
MSDVRMLDADTLTWTKLVTSGKILPPRAVHTYIALGKNLFVFGGFTDAVDLYNDLYMFDLVGEGPSARFSVAGSTLHPQHGGVLIFILGCNKKLEALNDMFYLFTDRQNVYLNEYHNPQGKRTFQAKVTKKNITNCYTIETVIDGKPLCGVLFSNNIKKTATDDLRRKIVAVERVKKGFEHDTTKSHEPEHHTPGATSATSDMKTPTTSNASPPHEVVFVILIIISLFCFRRVKWFLEVNKLNPSTATEDTANLIPNPNLGYDGESHPLTGEEHGQQVIAGVVKE